MLRKVLIVLAVSLGLLVLGSSAGAAVNDGDIQKMTDAMPAKAPAKPHKVLVYSHCGGFRHGSIPVGNKCFEIMGEKTGAFQAVVSDDLANFEPDKLKEFDGVLLNNCTGELFTLKGPRKPRKPDRKRIKDEAKFKQAEARYLKELAKYEEDLKKLKGQPDKSEELRKSFMDWIKNGGAVIGTHAATDCSYQWKEYGQMMGGYFAGHPWNQDVPLRNDDPTNPINAAFEGKGFTVKDEIYQFKRGVYSRYQLRTLLSLDMSKLKKKGGRKDNDYAISWVKMHGKGRVFYCSLGHRNEIFWNPVVLKHYLAGIQWALGDLKGVETKPNPLPESKEQPE